MNSNEYNNNKHCLLGTIPQANLHVKILDLVANRIKPCQQGVYYQKGECKTCIDTSEKSRNSQIQKKTQHEKTYSKGRKTSKKEESQTHPFGNSEIRKNIIGSKRNSSSHQILDQHKQRNLFLHIDSQVIFIHINQSKIAENEKSLKQVESQMLKIQELANNLQITVMEKDKEITRLQKQLENNQKYIKDLNKDIESIKQSTKDKVYSDNHLHNNEALSSVSIDPPSLKQVIMRGHQEKDQDALSSSLKSQQSISYPPNSQGNSCCQDFLRIILIQAMSLQEPLKLHEYY